MDTQLQAIQLLAIEQACWAPKKQSGCLWTIMIMTENWVRQLNNEVSTTVHHSKAGIGVSWLKADVYLLVLPTILSTTMYSYYEVYPS